MAKAPQPGKLTNVRPVERHEPNKRLVITVCGSTLELNQALPFKERFAVRAATGLPLSAFWAGEEKVDADSVLVLWWLARRANGEPRLSFEDAEAEWPDDLKPGDVEMEEIVDDEDEETDDPESSGPA